MAATAFNAGDCSERMPASAAAPAALSPSLRGAFDALAGERMHTAREAREARPSLPRDSQGMPVPQQASFMPLDPNILSESIAAFFIGRNADGLWVSRERYGRIGGIFLLKSSAVSFAHRHAGAAACATIFPTEGFELDIENNGNRLVGMVGAARRGVAAALKAHACNQGRVNSGDGCA
jgi:hypothetical protein